MTVVPPVLGGSGNDRFAKAASTLGKALILLIPLVFLAMKVIPRLLGQVKPTCNPELFLLFAIAVCLVTAALAQAVGFSVALGGIKTQNTNASRTLSAQFPQSAHQTERHNYCYRKKSRPGLGESHQFQSALISAVRLEVAPLRNSSRRVM